VRLLCLIPGKIRFLFRSVLVLCSFQLKGVLLEWEELLELLELQTFDLGRLVTEGEYPRYLHTSAGEFNVILIVDGER